MRDVAQRLVLRHFVRVQKRPVPHAGVVFEQAVLVSGSWDGKSSETQLRRI